MQRLQWLAILSQSAMLLGLLLVTGSLQAQDVGTSKEVPGKETPAAAQPESRRRPEPTLARELRSELFDAKIKLTNEQRARLSKVNAERADAFGGLARTGGSREEIANWQSEMSRLAKTYNEKMLEILTPEQKTIWEARKQEVIASGATAIVQQGSRDWRSQPILLREIRNEQFVAKIKLTEEQWIRLRELSLERNNVFREVSREGGTRQEVEKRMEEVSIRAETYEDKALEMLTPDQKVIWEAHKQAVNVPGNRGSTWPENPDRARIRALEVEVESLKTDVAKLKAAIEAKPATNAP
jgi:hypothetical protein